MKTPPSPPSRPYEQQEQKPIHQKRNGEGEGGQKRWSREEQITTKRHHYHYQHSHTSCTFLPLSVSTSVHPCTLHNPSHSFIKKKKTSR